MSSRERSGNRRLGRLVVEWGKPGVSSGKWAVASYGKWAKGPSCVSAPLRQETKKSPRAHDCAISYLCAMKAGLLALVLSVTSTSFAEPAHPQCGGDGNHQTDAKQPPAVFKSEQKVGTKATCPISGEEFTIAANSLHSEYKGKHVYFCCPGCKSRFDKDPEKYLGAKA